MQSGFAAPEENSLPARGRETLPWELINNIPVPLAVLDEEGKILGANRSFTGLVSLIDPSEIEGLELCGLMKCLTAPMAKCGKTGCAFESGMKSVSSGMISQFEDNWTVDTGKGSRKYKLTVCSFPFIPEAKALISVFDLDREQILENCMLYVSRMASLGDLVSGVAHELNNALSGVLGFGQLIAAEVGEGALRDDLLRLHRETRRTQDIVANLLHVSRKSGPEPKLFDLNAAIQSVIQVKSYQLRVENVKVDLDLSPEIPAISGRANELHQVILNLVNNAVDSVKSAGGKRNLSIRSMYSQTTGSVRMEVADTGSGIPADLRQRIFESFYTTKEPGTGTGLGLHICKSIVKSHGGKVSVSDNPDGGAIFTVDIPAGGKVKTGGAGSDIEAKGQPAVSDANILLVDDEPVIRELVPRILKPLSCEVDVAESVEIALTYIKKTNYDLILADMKMPEAGGEELLKILSRINPELAAKVCFITGDTVSPKTSNYLRKVPNPMLQKPFRHKELQSLVLRMLGATE